MIEQTLAIIKPDAVKAGVVGKIIDAIETHGFTIQQLKKDQMSREIAAKFYEAHKDKPFFGELLDFITSGPIIVMALEKKNAIHSWRDLMGATDPAKATAGTIRAQFGTDIGSNAVHGSDGPRSAKTELELLFG